jgi:hypothetical protein
VLLFVIEIIVEYFLIDAGFLGLVVPDVFVTLRWTIGAVIGSVNRGGLLVEDSLKSPASPSSHPGDGFEDLSELASVDAGSERGVSDEYSPDVFDAGGSIEVDGGEGELGGSSCHPRRDLDADWDIVDESIDSEHMCAIEPLVHPGGERFSSKHELEWAQLREIPGSNTVSNIGDPAL